MKKNYPLQLWKVLEKYLDKSGDLVEIYNADDSLLKYRDKDPDSDFYFKVKSHKVNNGKLSVQVERKPLNEINVGSGSSWTDESGLANSFESWLKLISDYNKIRSPFDDPILQHYTEEFYNHIQLTDPKANHEPFDLKAQLMIAEYVSEVKELLNSKPETEETKFLKEELVALEENLTKESQNKVLKRLSKFWAASRKVRLKFLNEVLNVGNKKFVNWLFEQAEQGIEFFGTFLGQGSN